MHAVRTAWAFTVAVVSRFARHAQLARAGQFSYVAFIAFIPFAFVVVSIASLTGTPAAYTALIDGIRPSIPAQLADFLDELANSITSVGTGQSIFFLIAGFLAGVWLAGNVAGALTDGLDDAFEQPHRPWLKGKARALVLAVVTALVLVVTSLLTVLGPPVLRWGLEQVGATRAAQVGAQWGVIIVGFLLFWVFLALLYHHAPHGGVAPWREALLGGAVGAVGWSVATYGFRLYVDNLASYNRVYGSLGAVVIFLVFLYLSGVMILAGGEATAEAVRRATARPAGGARPTG